MTTDLRHRICNNHPSGDGNSHKFSTVYNAGRMFHPRKDPRSCLIDGKVAKSLRTLFARQYCRAVPFELPDYTKRDLAEVKAELRHSAPAERRDGRVAGVPCPICST